MIQAGMQVEEESIAQEMKNNLASGKILPWRDLKAKIEKEYIVRLLQESAGEMPMACQLSGLSRARIYQLINRYEITV